MGNRQLDPKFWSFGIGAWVTINTSDRGILKTQKRYHYPFTGYGSMNAPFVHFGLGDRDLITELEIQWPSGQIQRFKGLRANQEIKIHEEDGLLPMSPP